MSDNLHVYRVGAPYHPDRRSWLEGVQYTYRSGGHELLLVFASPSAREIEAIRSGPASFAVAVHGPIICFLYRFAPAIAWSDAPYTIWMVPEEQRAVPLPAHTSEPHALLSIVLVDAATGLVRALRAVTLPPSLTTALHLAIRAQHEAGWPGQAAYDRALTALYRHYPTSDALLATAQARSDRVP